MMVERELFGRIASLYSYFLIHLNCIPRPTLIKLCVGKACNEKYGMEKSMVQTSNFNTANKSNANKKNSIVEIDRFCNILEENFLQFG